MGIHQKCPPPRTRTLAKLTAYTPVVAYLALGSPLCRFLLFKSSLVVVAAIVMVVALKLFM